MQKRSNIQALNIYAYSYSDGSNIQNQKHTQRFLPKITTKISGKKMNRSFNNYIPHEAPFVVLSIRSLINIIEKQNALDMPWERNVESVPEDDLAKEWSKMLLESNKIFSFHVFFPIPKIVQFDFYLSCLRYTLKGFFPKLIHFLNQDLLPILNKPLYDSTMRPNPYIKNVVRHAVLRCSRTIIDTASFLMIHMFHSYEYSTNMIETKKHLIKTYGNLLVSFECPPNILDLEDSTPESLFLGIILETTNIPFWNCLSGRRVMEAFDTISKHEKQMKRPIKKISLFPDVTNIMKYDIPLQHLKIGNMFHTINELYTEDFEVSETISSADINDRSTEDELPVEVDTANTSN